MDHCRGQQNAADDNSAHQETYNIRILRLVIRNSRDNAMAKYSGPISSQRSKSGQTPGFLKYCEIEAYLDRHRTVDVPGPETPAENI